MAVATEVSSGSGAGLQVQLPVRNGNKAKWEGLGVTWVESLERASLPFQALAKLPSGWTVQEKPATDFDQRSFTVIDGDNIPKAVVSMKLAAWDKYAYVKILPDKASEALATTCAPKPGQKEFDTLVAEYNSAVRTTHGMGSAGQRIIDKAYGALKGFADEHPQFLDQVPKCKHVCHDDGAGGAVGAMIALARTDTCKLQ